MSELENTYHFSFAEFGPAEVARITGIPQVKQRDWRRRGIIVAAGDGSHARFNTLHIAQLMVRQALADVGVELTESQKIAGLSAFILIDYAAREPSATGTVGNVSQEVIEHVAKNLTKPVQAHRYLTTFHPPVDLDRLEEGEAKDLLVSLFETHGRILPTQTIAEAANWAALFQGVGFADAWSVVDIEALGKKLARRAERPIQHIVMGTSGGANPTLRKFLSAEGR